MRAGGCDLSLLNGAVVRISFHLRDRGFDSRYGLMLKESVNALLKIVFLRELRFPLSEKVDWVV
jgi:hypothetical protein